MTALLEVEGLGKRFGGVDACHDVDLQINEGEVLGLIGPNGAGKTTVVNLVTGYFAPTTGAVRFDGKSTVGAPPHRLAARGLARTFQNLALFEGVTVLENVLIGRHLKFTDRRWNLFVKRHKQEKVQRDAARELLAQVGLQEYENEDVAGLPYGLRRRVEVARALALEPRLLLLDEPTAGMTRKESDDIGALIQSVNQTGVTVLLVDHNVRLVSEVCHRVAVMDWGTVVTEGSPEVVWADPKVQKAYLGVRESPKTHEGNGTGPANEVGSVSDAGDQ
jgi:branched-chain amino acid transport system ATP-binding protein